MKSLSALSLAILAGCYTAAPAGEHVWNLKLPKSVALETKLVFRAEAHTPDGTPVQGVPYVWRVDWVGVQGTRHQGRSFEDEKITAKGQPGTAVVRVFGYGPHESLIEVASGTVDVTAAAQPPAD